MEINLKFLNGSEIIVEGVQVTKHLAVYPNLLEAGGYFIYHLPTSLAVTLAPFPKKLAIYLCRKMEEMFDMGSFNRDTIKDILFDKTNKGIFNFACTLKRINNSTFLITKRAFSNTLNDVKNDNNTG